MKKRATATITTMTPPRAKTVFFILTTSCIYSPFSYALHQALLFSTGINKAALILIYVIVHHIQQRPIPAAPSSGVNRVVTHNDMMVLKDYQIE